MLCLHSSFIIHVNNMFLTDFQLSTALLKFETLCLNSALCALQQKLGYFLNISNAFIKYAKEIRSSEKLK